MGADSDLFPIIWNALILCNRDRAEGEVIVYIYWQIKLFSKMACKIFTTTLISLIAFGLILSCGPSKKYYSSTYSANSIRGNVSILSTYDTVSNKRSYVTGLVIDKESREEMPFVTVNLVNPTFGYKVVTDIYGKCEIGNIISEIYILETTLIGYFPNRDTIILNEGTAYNILIEMKRNPNSHFD